MQIRLPFLVVVAAAAAAASAAGQTRAGEVTPIVIHQANKDVVIVRRGAGAYQGRDRGPEQTERFSRKAKLGRDGRFTIENISGNITVTGGGGDEVLIEAVKRTRRDAAQLASVHINVEERAGRVDVRTDHTARTDSVAVDYTITVPASAAVEAKSVSGNVKVTGVQGAVRAETISGNVTSASTPKLEYVKSVSGDVELTNASADAELTASNISGNIRARGLKARGLDVGTVSGDIVLGDVSCERLDAKSVSGSVEYTGSLTRAGRYALNVHSGNIRLALSGGIGFAVNANTFSGNIHTDVPLTDSTSTQRRFGPGRSIRGVVGDGSASVTVRTFSGDITISKR